MRKVLLLSLSILLVAMFYGCGGGVPNQHDVKIEFKGTGATEVSGFIKSESPGKAGFSSQSFKTNVPGSVELKAGADCSYDIRVMPWPKENMELKVYLDGKELDAGQCLGAFTGPTEYSVVFEIKKDAK